MPCLDLYEVTKIPTEEVFDSRNRGHADVARVIEIPFRKDIVFHVLQGQLMSSRAEG